MTEFIIIIFCGLILLIIGLFLEYKGEYDDYIGNNLKRILLLEIFGGFYIAIGFLALLIGLGGYTFLSTIPK